MANGEGVLRKNFILLTLKTFIMEKLDFKQMEELEGGDTASAICEGIFFGTGAALGLAVAVYTVGTAAIAGWALTTYVGAIGLAVC